ncbi:MAG: hypothetical protein WEE51_09875 [Pirellulaceae bacterium]
MIVEEIIHSAKLTAGTHSSHTTHHSAHAPHAASSCGCSAAKRAGCACSGGLSNPSGAHNSRLLPPCPHRSASGTTISATSP